MIQAFIGAVRFRGQAAGRQDLNYVLQPSSIIQDAGWLLSDYGLQQMSISNMALNNLPELLSYLLGYVEFVGPIYSKRYYCVQVQI